MAGGGRIALSTSRRPAGSVHGVSGANVSIPAPIRADITSLVGQTDGATCPSVEPIAPLGLFSSRARAIRRAAFPGDRGGAHAARFRVVGVFSIRLKASDQAGRNFAELLPTCVAGFVLHGIQASHEGFRNAEEQRREIENV